MLPEQVEAWVRAVYPQHVNPTCGLHVHMSFAHKLNYSRLMTPEFTPYMLDALRAWGQSEGLPEADPLWERLNRPDHPHCSHQYLADKQVLMRKKDYQSRGTDHSRYTAINYCEAQHRGNGSGTGTVECRVLPMFQEPDVAMRAIWAVVDNTNRFLSRIRQREKATEATVLARPEVFQEFGTTIR